MIFSLLSRTNLKRKNDDSDPDEFLDALTCKRMNVPMLLPCGQYVDRASLDHYNEIEAKWGRSPNDPFTGLAFTDVRKAIFDAKLKSRIDTFVLGVHQGAAASTSKLTKVDNSSSDKNFDYKGGNLDALLSQALEGRQRILGASKKAKECEKCGQSSAALDLYTANCCCNKCDVMIMCKSCLLRSGDEKWKCNACNKPLTKRDFAKCHHKY